MDAVSLARALSKLGHSSRAEARRLIAAGRVSVDGDVVHDPEHRVDLRRVRIAVDGRAIRAASRVYLALHKPAGAITSSAAERGRVTAYDLLPAGLPRVVAAGRLDADSEGLLLFTNDTRWANRINEPRSHVAKVYHVLVDRDLSAAERDAATRGVVSRGEVLRLQEIARLNPSHARADGIWLRIVLHEGKNRQIRRVLEVLGVVTHRLVRVAIGPISLADLKPGATRVLSAAEVAAVDPAHERRR